MTVSRRTLMKILGLAPTLAPLTRSLLAQGQGTNGLRRVIVFLSPNGVHQPSFWPTGTGNAFEFGYHKVLNSIKKDMLVIKGISVERRSEGGAHCPSSGTIMTGVPLLPGNLFGDGPTSRICGWASGISVDQHIGNALKAAGKSGAIPVLNLGAYVYDKTPFGRPFYFGANRPVAPITDPYAAFESVGKLIVPDGSVPLPPPAPVPSSPTPERTGPNVEKLVLDSIVDDIKKLKAAVGVSEREKLEAHLEALRTANQSIFQPEMGGEASPGGGTGAPIVAGAQCKTIATPAGTRINPDTNAAFPAVVKMQLDLIVAAMACNITRVATMQLSMTSRQGPVMSWAGIPGSCHDNSHMMSPTDTTNYARNVNWFAEQYVYLVNALAKIPEGNGTMLDNTLVLWTSELAQKHSYSPLPLIITGGPGAGKANFMMTTGPHNRTLQTLCQWMGVPPMDFKSIGTFQPIV